MARVFDVFTLFNELDLLELRLEMLYPYVDQFVLIECVVIYLFYGPAYGSKGIVKAIRAHGLSRR